MDDAGLVVHGEKKTKLLAHDIAMLSRAYDLRIATATEIKIPSPAIGQMQQFRRVRLKKRTTYTPLPATSGQKPIWKIDITEVESFPLDPRISTAVGSVVPSIETNSIPTATTTTTAAAAATTATGRGGSNGAPASSMIEKSIELEFELMSDALNHWISMTDDAPAIEFTKVITAELLKLVSFLVPGHSEPAVNETIVLQKSAGHYNLARELVNTIRATVSLEPSSKLEFIGSMPVNISRSNLIQLQRNPYFVTEKSDGMRYLLLVLDESLLKAGDSSGRAVNSSGSRNASHTPSPVAVLMTREGDLRIFPGCRLTGISLGLGTILDGELVYNRTLKRQVFLIFDVLSDGDRICLHRPFRERLHLMNKSVMDRLARENWSIHDTDFKSLPILLVRKYFFEKESIFELLGRIRTEDMDRVYYDSERRHHRTDGIILQPDSSYSFGTDFSLLKWKWPDMRSVDLLAEFPPSNPRHRVGEIRLSCAGPDNTLIDCSRRAMLGQFDIWRLIGDTRELMSIQQRPCIVECCYQSELGTWSYFHVREDKTQPNMIYTVMSVLMEQADSISIEELECTLAPIPGVDNDFGDEIRKFTAELVQRRRANRVSQIKAPANTSKASTEEV